MTVLLSGTFLIFTILFVGILVTQPYQNWLRDFRIFGLCYNIAGAFLSVIPRALRDKKDIEALAGTYYNENPHFKAFLLRDTRIAQIGMIIFGIGFALQLVGNLG
jgi:hypothetical protein